MFIKCLCIHPTRFYGAYYEPALLYINKKSLRNEVHDIGEENNNKCLNDQNTLLLMLINCIKT